MLRYTGLILLVFALSFVAAAQENGLDPDRIRASTLRVTEEGFNQGDMAVIDEIFAEDFAYYGPAATELTSLEDFKNTILAFRAAIPDFEAVSRLIVIEDEWVAFHFSVGGTFENELVAVDGSVTPPTGEPLYLNTILILQLNEEGKVAGGWLEYDNIEFLTQAGLLPNLDGSTFSREEISHEEMTASDEMEAANKETIMRLFDEINAGNLDVIDEIYTEDHLGHDPGNDTTREEGKAAIMTLKNAMPDLTVTVDAIAAQGDLVGFRVTYSGTFTEELNLAGQTFPPTNQPVTVSQNIISRFNENGQIVEEWIAYDRLSLFTQPGVFQMPE